MRKKKKNIIEINGQRYDAQTATPLPAVVPPKPAAHADIVRRRPAKPVAGHAPKASRTLMRQGVHKPHPSLKRQLKIQGHTDILAEPTLSVVKPNLSVQQLDAKRLRKANRIAKSQLISHFVPPTANQLPLAAGTPHQPPEAPRPVTAKLAAMPAPAAAKHTRTTADILAQAIENATSHEQPAPKIRHGRAKRNASISAAIGLSVLVLGFIISQNLGNVRLQMASAKAGFDASLPTYHPAGYSLGQLNYSNGVVAAQFHSNSNNNLYTVTQKQSSWDSTTLLSTFVIPRDPNYQTAQTGGQTVYLYGDGNATWVSGGIWYVIQTQGALNNRQLVELAGSL